jgi:two-component system, LytTR family, response regulator
VRVLIVDDEPAARKRVRDLLARRDGVTVAAECGDVPSARAMLAFARPHVVFLDVRMPGADGFELVQDQGAAALPVIVFVTAYDAHAVRAFEVRAVDYLLKPFDEERFDAALLRAREEVERRLAAGANQRRADEVEPAPGAGYPERLALRSAGRVVLVRSDDIDWIDAAGNYVRIHVAGKAHEVRESIGAIEGELDRRRFVRIHRSTIVNVDRIVELRLTPLGGYLALLENGKLLSVSRSYRDRLHLLLRSPV